RRRGHRREPGREGEDMKRFWLAAAIVVCLTSSAFVEEAGEIVSVKVLPGAGQFEPGRSFELVLEVSIRDFYHINSSAPLEDYLIPTTVDFEAVPGVQFGKPVFPMAENIRLPFSENPLAV